MLSSFSCSTVRMNHIDMFSVSAIFSETLMDKGCGIMKCGSGANRDFLMRLRNLVKNDGEPKRSEPESKKSK